MSKITLTKKLTTEEQQEILNDLFDFNVVEVTPGNFVIHDQDGDEFCSFHASIKFDLSTLGGIIDYAVHITKTCERVQCQIEIHKAKQINT